MWAKLEMPVQTPKGNMFGGHLLLRHGACSRLHGVAEPCMYFLSGPPRCLLQLLLVLCAITILILLKSLLRRKSKIGITVDTTSDLSHFKFCPKFCGLPALTLPKADCNILMQVRVVLVHLWWQGSSL